MAKYKLVNYNDPNETTELKAETDEKAMEEALEMLGYFVSLED